MVETTDEVTQKDSEEALEEKEEVQEISEELEKKQESSQEPQLKELSEKEVGTKPAHGLDFIIDIPLEVSVELGRTRMVVNDVLRLGHGSIIELDKMAGEPLEILVNQRLIARGDVVVVNEKFGVRLTDIISPTERVKKLGKPK